IARWPAPPPRACSRCWRRRPTAGWWRSTAAGYRSRTATRCPRTTRTVRWRWWAGCVRPRPRTSGPPPPGRCTRSTRPRWPRPPGWTGWRRPSSSPGTCWRPRRTPPRSRASPPSPAPRPPPAPTCPTPSSGGSSPAGRWSGTSSWPGGRRASCPGTRPSGPGFGRGDARTPRRRTPSSTPSSGTAERRRSRPRRRTNRPPGADVDDSVRAGTTSAEVTRRAVATRSGQRDELGVVVAPQVLVAVGQEEHPLGLERLDGALVVRDEDDGSGVGAQRGEDLLPRGGVEVVRRFVEQEDVGRGDDEHRERQPGLLPAGEHLRRLVGVVPGEEEGAEHRPHLGVGEVRGGGAQVLHHGPVDVEGLVLLGVVAYLQPVAGHDRTGVRLLDAGEDAQQGRLARAVEPQHDDLRAAVDGEVDVGEHLQRAVGLRQPLGGERDLAARRRVGEAQVGDLVRAPGLLQPGEHPLGPADHVLRGDRLRRLGPHLVRLGHERGGLLL